MGIIFATIAIYLTFYSDDIKGLKSYSIFSERPNLSYRLTTKYAGNNELKTLTYTPNTMSFSGMSFANEQFGIAISTEASSTETEGIKPTEVLDIQFQGSLDNKLVEIYYQNYQNLYISDSNLIGNSLPKADSWAYGIGVKHFTKENFELNKSYSNNSHHKKSDWSWLHGASISKAKLFSNAGLIPYAFAENFQQLKDLKGIETTSLGYEFGITGLYAYKGFFVSALLDIGIQLQKQEFFGLDQRSRELTDSTISLFFEAGYITKKRNSFGLKLAGNTAEFPIKNASFTYSRSLTTMYYKYFF